jgi:hypothetical protein
MIEESQRIGCSRHDFLLILSDGMGMSSLSTLVTRPSTHHHLDNDNHFSAEKMTIVATAGDHDGSKG